MDSRMSGASLNRYVFLASLVIGIVALTLGVIASESISSSLSQLFKGRPTDNAIWLLIGGSIATVAGLVGLARGSR